MPIAIWVIGIFTAGIIGSIIHYIRFVPSPEGDAPFSIVIATFLLIAMISGYLLVLWAFGWLASKRDIGSGSMASPEDIHFGLICWPKPPRFL